MYILQPQPTGCRRRCQEFGYKIMMIEEYREKIAGRGEKSENDKFAVIAIFKYLDSLNFFFFFFCLRICHVDAFSKRK